MEHHAVDVGDVFSPRGRGSSSGGGVGSPAVQTERWGRVVGRERETRVIRAFAAGFDLAALVVSGPAGIGKTATTVAALRDLHLPGPTVRLGGLSAGRPHVFSLSRHYGIDLTGWPSVRASTDGQLLTGIDADAFLSRLAREVERRGERDRARLLFVDDVGHLTAEKEDALDTLGEQAFAHGWRVVVAARGRTSQVERDDLRVLELDPLDGSAVRALLASYLEAPVATDLADRVAWWSAGNPRLALEIAENLTPAQLQGGAPWAPTTVGEAARRAYRPVLASLAADEVAVLAAAVPVADSGDVPPVDDDAPGIAVLAARGLLERRESGWAVTHPLLALLCRQRAVVGRRARGGSAVGAVASLAAVTTPADVTQVVRGLHLDALGPGALAELARAGSPTAYALAYQAALLTGLPLTGDLDLFPVLDRSAYDGKGDGWPDQVWWRDPGLVEPGTRAAGRRLAAALAGLELTGLTADQGRLHADLRALSGTPGQDWAGMHLRVRAFLALGDLEGAVTLLADTARPAAGRSVLERVARELARAMVAAVQWRSADARRHVEAAAMLRPAVAGWPFVRGQRALDRAVHDGVEPAGEATPDREQWSPRAFGEHAAAVGSAHLALGGAREALALLTVALEHCAWPYQDRILVQADLVEAAAAAGGLADGVPAVVDAVVAPHDARRRRLGRWIARVLGEPDAGPEPRRPDAVAAAARARAVLAPPDDAEGAFEAALAASLPPATPAARLRALVAYGRWCARRGDHVTAGTLLDEASALARISGAAGWARGAGAVRAAGRPLGLGHDWDVLTGDERELVRLATSGATNARIAETVFVSERTVVNRLRSIYARLGIRDRRDLVQIARSAPPEWLSS
ncbi:helix-turn-helix transcriptional regulator [Antribacter gilvus]|uniref:helix-turn-helix transcriptional regulator n=1 Tax=Antribacter gilvus TaxID=2304675 RepID=UPI000F767CAA|nr:LuxR family transcriptional regulator [Antribacter gilvus]